MWKSLQKYKIVFGNLWLLLGIFLVTSDSFAVTVVALQGPVDELNKTIFGGWMVVVKIVAAVMGIVMSVFRGSLTPFGMGAGLGMGIHFYQQYLAAAATGILI
jgi:hypothetical protein